MMEREKIDQYVSTLPQQAGAAVDCWYDPEAPAQTVTLTPARSRVPWQSLSDARLGLVFAQVFALPLVVLTLWVWYLPIGDEYGWGPCCCCGRTCNRNY